MNFTNFTSTLTSPSPACPATQLLWNEEFLVEKSFFILLAVAINLASCPCTVLMNMLVIVAVKTRHRLQTKQNILLACLAATDLLVGAIVQPSFIVAQMFVLNGLSQTVYCRYFDVASRTFFIPFAASLFHMALLSIERYVALKFALRYENIVTTTRIKSAVICIWLVSVVPNIPYGDFKILKNILTMIYLACRIGALVAIVYCHISVYIVTRKHEKQILAAQVSPEAAAKFLKEKKALKTTTIIISVLLICYLPLFTALVVKPLAVPSGYFSSLITLAQPLFLSVTLLNSFCNPVIYRFRNKMFRQAFIELL